MDYPTGQPTICKYLYRTEAALSLRTHTIEARSRGVQGRDKKDEVQLDAGLGPRVQRRSRDGLVEMDIALDLGDLGRLVLVDVVAERGSGGRLVSLDFRGRSHWVSSTGGSDAFLTMIKWVSVSVWPEQSCIKI